MTTALSLGPLVDAVSDYLYDYRCGFFPHGDGAVFITRIVILAFDTPPNGIRFNEIPDRPIDWATTVAPWEAVEQWIPLPATEGPCHEPDLDHGRWRVAFECSECGGLGERYCDMDHLHDCDICDSKGVVIDFCECAKKAVAVPVEPPIKVHHYLLHELSQAFPSIECGRAAGSELLFLRAAGVRGAVAGLAER